MRNYWTFEVAYEEEELPMCGGCGKFMDLVEIEEAVYALPEKCSECGWKPTEFTPQDKGG